MRNTTKLALAAFAVSAALSSTSANAACTDITFTELQAKANNALASDTTGGLGLNMWVTFVDETGVVCRVVNTGVKGAKAGNSQWLGSRVISAQKANTANAFSLDTLAISTGALYAAVQPGGSLFGLQESNPVNASVAYLGSAATFGTATDPLLGKRIGGVNVFGGGLAVYKAGKKIGAIGVSGDTSCTDHAFAWKVRNLLGLEPGATVNPVEKLDLVTSGFTALGKHPTCIGDAITYLDGFVTQ